MTPHSEIDDMYVVERELHPDSDPEPDDSVSWGGSLVMTTPHSETDELEEVLAIALTIAFTRGKVAERNKHSERPYTITAEERGQAKAAIERIIQRRVVEEATRAREVAFNHRMDSGHDVALVLAARVKGLEAQLTQIK